MGKTATDALPAVRVVSSGQQRRRSSKISDVAVASKGPIEATGRKEQRHAKLREFQGTLTQLKQQRDQDAKMLAHLRSELEVYREYETKGKQLEQENEKLQQELVDALKQKSDEDAKMVALLRSELEVCREYETKGKQLEQDNARLQQQLEQLTQQLQQRDSQGELQPVDPLARKAEEENPADKEEIRRLKSKINKAIAKADKYKAKTLRLEEQLRQSKQDVMNMSLMLQQQEDQALPIDEERAEARKERRRSKQQQQQQQQQEEQQPQEQQQQPLGSSSKSVKGSSGGKSPKKMAAASVESRLTMELESRLTMEVLTNPPQEEEGQQDHPDDISPYISNAFDSQDIKWSGHDVPPALPDIAMPEEIPDVAMLEEFPAVVVPEEIPWNPPPVEEIAVRNLPEGESDIFSGLEAEAPPLPSISVPIVESWEDYANKAPAAEQAEEYIRAAAEEKPHVVVKQPAPRPPKEFDKDQRRIVFPKIGSQVNLWQKKVEKAEEQKLMEEEEEESEPTEPMEPARKAVVNTRTPGFRLQESPAEAWKRRKEAKKLKKEGKVQQVRKETQAKSSIDAAIEKQKSWKDEQQASEFMSMFKNIAVHHEDNAVVASGTVPVGAGVFVGKHGIQYSGAAEEERRAEEKRKREEEEERLAAEEEARWEKEEEERKAREYAEQREEELRREQEYKEKREREIQLANERKERERQAAEAAAIREKEEREAKAKAEQEAKEKAEQEAREKAEADRKAAEEAAKNAPPAAAAAPPPAAPAPPPKKKSFLDSSSDEDSDDSPPRKAPAPPPPKAAAPPPAAPAKKKKSFFDDSDSDDSDSS